MMEVQHLILMGVCFYMGKRKDNQAKGLQSAGLKPTQAWRNHNPCTTSSHFSQLLLINIILFSKVSFIWGFKITRIYTPKIHCILITFF